MTEQDIRERYGPALDRLEGDFELLRQMAAVTVPDCKSTLDRLTDSILRSDCPVAAKTIHRLKGMLSTFENKDVVVELQALIELARGERPAELQRAFDRVRPQIRACIADLNQLAIHHV